MARDLTICGHRDPVTRKLDCTQPRWKQGVTYCRRHEDEYRAAKRNGTRPTRGTQAAAATLATLAPVVPTTDRATDEEMALSHEYVPMPELAALWTSVIKGMATKPAANLMFVGPSGSGKTDGARYLAALVNLDFTKVDAASMTDPEAWFGTREIVVQDGVAVTEYHPSEFIESLQRPGVTLIDEVTRVRDEHRNVLLPILDHTRQVLNPLTGEIVKRHPQNIIILAGNVGLHFTGTNAVDPAFKTRCRVVEFDYIDAATEQRIVTQASGCDDETAQIIVNFATKTREKAASDPEFVPISTRELIAIGESVADGLDRDLAVKFVVLNNASNEGGSASIRQELTNLWNGVRILAKSPTAGLGGDGWKCPIHHQAKTVPAGFSTKTNKPYSSFKACPVPGCQNTEGRATQAPFAPTTTIGARKYCPQGHPNAAHMTSCVACGMAI